MASTGVVIEWDQLWQMRREAIWDGLVLLGKAFLQAAATQPWMWLVAAVVLTTMTRRAWLRLLRYVGVAALRSSDRD